MKAGKGGREEESRQGKKVRRKRKWLMKGKDPMTQLQMKG